MVTIGPAIKGKDIDFKVSKQTLRLGVKGSSHQKVEGRLFAELKNLDDCMFEIEGAGTDRHVAVTLEKRRNAMWSSLLEREMLPSGDNEETCDLCEDASGGQINFFSPAARRMNRMNPPSRAEQRFGIHSFAYQRRRPFSAQRLEKLLVAWPTPRKDLFTLRDLEPSGADHNAEESSASTLRPVLRSKGFCWLDSEPLKQQVLAHAGKTLALQAADWWWDALDKEQLKFKVTYPGVEAEYKQIRAEKWDRDVGDRRQELVFIGGPLMKEQEQIQDLNKKSEKMEEEERLTRKQDREDTDFLRGLGVGSALEPETDVSNDFEAID
jgi:hypothetical protein